MRELTPEEKSMCKATNDAFEASIAEAKAALRPVFRSICAKDAQNSDQEPRHVLVYAALELLTEMRHQEKPEHHDSWCEFLSDALNECRGQEDARALGTWPRITPL